MREVVLDTETTGLDPEQGDRIVEIGAVELKNHLPTGKTYHQYINPKRAMPAEAFAVHGLGDDFLRDKPVFSEIVDGFLNFVGDAKLIIHNASFDMKFINAELRWAERTQLPKDQALDTLVIARRKFPGSPASLDALCRRFGINSFDRTLHGALLDSEILAQVYLEIIGGRQPDFGLSQSSIDVKKTSQDPSDTSPVLKRPAALKSRLTDQEKASHSEFVDALGPDALWRKGIKA